MTDVARTGRSFIGRTETVEALHRRLDEVRGGAGGVSLLVGETGIGKSTLISQFVQEIRARRIRALVGRSLALDDPPPFSLLRSAIDSARDDPVIQSDENPFFGAGAVMIGFAPGLGDAAFPTPVGIEERLLEALGGTETPSPTTPDQVLTGIADRLLEFTRHGPTVMIFEDLHRADKSSLAAVEFFAKELKERPLWILATSRPPASLSAFGRTRVEAFESAAGAARIVLPPMTSEEVASFLRLNEPSREFSPGEVARRYSETSGNPLLLQQLDHRNSPGGPLDGPTGASLAPPDEVERRTLDLASVLGPEFPFALLLGASGENEESLAEVVDRLVGRGLLFERSGEVLEFPQDRLREETYDFLPERRRRTLHRKAGEALESLGDTDVSLVYTIARHFYLGHESQKSVHYNRIAAEIAERALAPEAAWDYFSRALESQRELTPENLDDEAELVLALGRITEELGLLQDAEGILEDFLDRERNDARLSPGRRATLELFLARVRIDQGDNPAAAELAEKVLATPGLEDQLLVRIAAHRQLGMTLYYAANYPEALAQHTEEIRLARETGNDLVVARAQVWRVANLAMLGQTQDAIAEAREATATRDRLGSVRESAMAHLFLGDILADARSTPRQRDEAKVQFAEAIRFAEKAKDPRRIGWALYKTAELLLEAQRLEEAVVKVQRASDIFGQIGDRVGLSMSLKVRGQIATDQGAYELAETHLLEAFRLLQGLKHALEEIDVVLRLAQLSQLRGERDAAREYFAELERRNLLTARPDLAVEFERLKIALAGSGSSAS
ncbi:MAG TPA: AAA family ATPase [Thermoplasmata archaeon]|nr:AAA family ATPase [Thermoplasmata archaeon]